MEEYLAGPPLEEIEPRVKKLQAELRRKDINGALIVQNTDLYYFSGTSQQGWLYIPVEGSPLLMVFKDFERARAESPLADIVSLVSPKKIPQTLREYGHEFPALLGMELDVLPVNLYFQFLKIFHGSSIVDVATPIRLVRAIKSAWEIEKIRTSAAFSDKLASHFRQLLEAGKTEVALAGELEAYARSLGHQGIVRMRLFGSELFYGHLMSGPAAAVPSYLASPTGGKGVSGLISQGAGFRKINSNESVLVDYVFAYDGYISDHSRIFVIGDLPDEMYRAHEVMLEMQERIKKEAVPGAVSGDIYQLMIDMAEERGCAQQFMGVGERKIRFTGHGVGLELDEFPFLAKGQQLELAEGMVIALEPKVIMPGKGVVGIENTHLVTASGLEQLGQFPDGICRVS